MSVSFVCVYYCISFVQMASTRWMVCLFCQSATVSHIDYFHYGVIYFSVLWLNKLIIFFYCQSVVCMGGTGISGLMRGLATLPQGGSRSLQWSETGMEDPQEDPLAAYCFCVCRGSALLGDLLGVTRSMERDLLSVLSIYSSCSSAYSLCIVAFYSAICWWVLIALVL